MKNTIKYRARMKTKILISMIITSMLIGSSLTGTGQNIVHGFKLIEKRFVKEVNADCYYYEHVQSGAKLFKIAANDDNKTFGIAFKTFPSSDNGVAHIMEHSVLNGSKKFPVKSPFDVLVKGSLKTFLNAFTSKDFTMYPCASMNDKDYFNLMNVYLDAVFNPLIYTDKRIFNQEGWHYEITSKDAPLTYKGVVYNEMKGAYSSPTRELSYQVYKNLMPNSPYGFESGGYPTAIPTLTYEDFINFHKKFYCPENSYIMLYGNADMDKELEFIDKEYLSKYTKTGVKLEIADQEKFTAIKSVDAYYGVMDNADTKNQTYLSLSFVAGNNTNYSLSMALDIICDALFNQESAPVRLALQDAKIGQDVSASVSNYKQNIITITVPNANAEDKDRFFEVVMKTLQEITIKGINKKEIEGIINRTEFQLREGNDAQKGISYLSQIEPGWFFADDPFLGLEYEKPLAAVKKALTSNYLEDLVEKYFIKNTHGLRVCMQPKQNLENEKNANVEKSLSEIKNTFNATQIDELVKETEELIDFQKREDSHEALSKIPLLNLSDINPKAQWYGCEEKRNEGTRYLYHEEFTNNIVYCDIMFDLHVLPQNMLAYASLLSNILGSLDTKNYKYGDLNRELNIHTGGFYTNLDTYFENQDDNKMVAKFVVSSKVLKNEIGKMFELTGDILKNTIYDDTARLKTVLMRHLSQLESSMKRDGSKVAATRFASYFTNRGMFNEITGNLEYYWFISKVAKKFDKSPFEILKALQETAQLLFTKENMMVSITCGKDDEEVFVKNLAGFQNLLPTGSNSRNEWDFTTVNKNEGIQTPSKVQYVIAGYDYKKLGYSWNGKMRVLNQIISRDWLTNQIRVIGGAYGGYSTISPNGTITFNSYRDPNLKSTLENYYATPDYLNKFDADEKAMTRYIIGTISGLDIPMTAQQKGDNALANYFTHRTLEDVQKDRDAILATKASDIKGFAKMIQDVVDKKIMCVYGNQDKISAEKDSFSKLITIESR
jgi:presequence protease